MSQLFSKLLSQQTWFKHSFGTLAHPAPLEWQDWDNRPQKKQIHSAIVSEAKHLGEKLPDCDAVWTGAPHVPISVISADCVPILLASTQSHVVGAAHSGWRGTQAGILSALVREMARTSGDTKQRWVAAVGPHIRACCYEVSLDLAHQFSRQFGSYVIQGERNLDLTACVTQTLHELGIEEIDLVGGCTRCSVTPNGQPEFHSYRREGGNTRQWSSLMITARD